MKKLVGLLIAWLAFNQCVLSQADSAYIYNTSMPYGTLDIRLSKSPTWYYYLQENKTFSFRESSPGVKTDTYRDMTSWNSAPYTQGNLREKNGSIDNFIMNYRLLFPVNYNPAYADGYPLIIMMHGAGERGNCWDTNCYWGDRNWNPYSNIPPAPTTSTHSLLNNDHNLLHGGLVHMQARDLAGSRLPNDPTMPARAFPGFILFPQNLNGWNPNSVQDAIRIIRLISSKYKIDRNRIYVHGLSNGGEATYEIIKRAPWMFAAALPMSAISDANSINNGLAPKIATIPLWVFQGGVDTNPTPTKTEFFVKKFREAGGIVRYTKYETIGHGVWNSAYNEPDFFSWILQQDRANIHVFGNQAAVCRTNNTGVKLELPEGHFAYQWERDGVIIPEATSAALVATEPGIYRGRFSRISATPTENQWNKWSAALTVTEQNPAQAQIAQKGSVLLRDLNFNNNAYLNSVGNAAHYYWYKDGALVDLQGSQDDTTKYATFRSGICVDPTPCPGNGVYTLVTAGFDNCPSPPSEPKYIFFENQAPISITAPVTFTGSASSASTASLSWTDNSDNEGGFEVWRRKVTGPSTFTIWTMSVLTGPDVTSFIDSGLEPNSTYQYKIRAVSNSARSNYTPLASNQFLIIATSGDTQPPTAPSALTATSTAIKEITLTWQPSTDDTGIKQYYILYGSDTVKTGTPVTTYRLSNLTLNKVYNFTVKAVDFGNNVSAASNTASAHTYVSGLYYEHSTGAWTDLDQINWSMAEFKGQVTNFTLAPRTQEDFFNFEFEGYLYITRGGTYRFRITSDDGSRLTLNNTVIADNDGVHTSTTVSSADINLTAGPHLINVKFFEYTSSQSLTVQYRGRDTGTLWKTIPNSALKSGTPPAGTASSSTISSAMAGAEEAPSTNPFDASIYPNPISSGDDLRVTVNAMPDVPVKINLNSLFGKSYYDKTLEPDEVIDGATITTRERLPKGIYTLTITQGNNSVKRRVIIKD